MGSARRSLKFPITLAVVMIILVVLLLIGWIISTVYGAREAHAVSTMYWVFLPLGAVFISLILAGVIAYLIFSIKVVNITRQQSNFIDSVTHELKSPLASLKLYLQTLSRYDVPPQQRSEFIQSMMEDVERLDLLINQVLRAGQLESGIKISSPPEQILLERYLRNCIHSACVRFRVPEERVRLQCTPCSVTASRIQLDIVLRNLIDNAVKYARVPQEVSVSVRTAQKKKVFIRITDNGPGIPRHLRKHLFRRFSRLGNELERTKPGTGLGLYITRLTLSQMHGKVRIRDRKDKHGCHFCVYLPLNVSTVSENMENDNMDYSEHPENTE